MIPLFPNRSIAGIALAMGLLFLLPSLVKKYWRPVPATGPPLHAGNSAFRTDRTTEERSGEKDDWGQMIAASWPPAC